MMTTFIFTSGFVIHPHCTHLISFPVGIFVRQFTDSLIFMPYYCIISLLGNFVKVTQTLLLTSVESGLYLQADTRFQLSWLLWKNMVNMNDYESVADYESVVDYVSVGNR